MLKIIPNVIGEISSSQADVVIAVMSFMSACIVAGIGLFGSVLTIILDKKNERKVELRKIKEKQYIEFLEKIAEAKIVLGEERHSINKILSSRIQTIYLIGDKNVQETMHEFLQIFTEKVDADKQNKLYANLIEAMKKDLYGKKAASLASVSFTVFSDKK